MSEAQRKEILQLPKKARGPGQIGTAGRLDLFAWQRMLARLERKALCDERETPAFKKSRVAPTLGRVLLAAGVGDGSPMVNETTGGRTRPRGSRRLAESASARHPPKGYATSNVQALRSLESTNTGEGRWQTATTYLNSPTAFRIGFLPNALTHHPVATKPVGSCYARHPSRAQSGPFARPG